MSVSTYRFHVGQFECLILQAGSGPMPAINLFPDIPKEEVEKIAHQLGLDPDALDFSMNILLVNTGSHLVLVDTGTGEINLPEALKSQGIDPATIDTVVISHGHGDHVCGLVDAAGNFQYPNARHVIGQTEYDYWTDPERLAQDTRPAIPVWKILQANQDKIHLIDIGKAGEETEIAPGVCAISTPGHTVGHIAVTVESGADRLLHIVDVAHSVIQLTRSDWSPKFDYDKIQSAGTRRKLFERAARDKALMLAYHFPFPGLGHVTADGDALHWTALEAT